MCPYYVALDYGAQPPLSQSVSNAHRKASARCNNQTLKVNMNNKDLQDNLYDQIPPPAVLRFISQVTQVLRMNINALQISVARYQGALCIWKNALQIL